MKTKLLALLFIVASLAAIVKHENKYERGTVVYKAAANITCRYPILVKDSDNTIDRQCANKEEYDYLKEGSVVVHNNIWYNYIYLWLLWAIVAYWSWVLIDGKKED